MIVLDGRPYLQERRLSDDHRIIDGKESVSFLYKVKEMIEDPNKLVFGGKDPGEVLLGL